jgi:hypothetical protein
MTLKKTAMVRVSTMVRNPATVRNSLTAFNSATVPNSAIACIFTGEDQWIVHTRSDLGPTSYGTQDNSSKLCRIWNPKADTASRLLLSILNTQSATNPN